MIDEKKLIEDLQKCFVNNSIHKNDLAEAIAKQPKVGEWIPCSERLPLEEYESAKIARGENAVYPVLITRKAFSFEENRERNIVKQAWFLDYMGETDFYNLDLERVEAIAWMPLPAPYNVKRGGKNEENI